MSAGPPSADARAVATRLQLSFMRDNGSPVEHAMYGWYYEGSDADAQRFQGSSQTGRTELLEDLPPGKLTVYAVELTESPRYGSATVKVVPGTALRVALVADRALHVVRGRTVDATGQPLAGPVTATASGATVWTRFDRELLEAQGGQTDTLGRFRFMFASSAPVQLQLGGWTAGDGSEQRHYGTRPIAVLDVKPAEVHAEVTLQAPQVRTVRCEIVDDAQRPLPIEHFGLSFGPHTNWAHSGNCVDVLLNEGQSAERAASSVQFVWPEGADTLEVELTAALEPGATVQRAGRLTLSTQGPSECRIAGVAIQDP